jgi:hypothetical protein
MVNTLISSLSWRYLPIRALALNDRGFINPDEGNRLEPNVGDQTIPRTVEQKKRWIRHSLFEQWIRVCVNIGHTCQKQRDATNDKGEENDCLLGCCALLTEAVTTSETSASVYQTPRRNIPEDSHLNSEACFSLSLAPYHQAKDPATLHIWRPSPPSAT